MKLGFLLLLSAAAWGQGLFPMPGPGNPPAGGSTTPPSFVQACTGQLGASATISCNANGATFAGNVTSGNIVVGATGNINGAARTLSSIALSGGDTATIGTPVILQNKSVTGTGLVNGATFCVPITGTGTFAPLATWSGSSTASGIVIVAIEVSGQKTAGGACSVLDGDNLTAGDAGVGCVGHSGGVNTSPSITTATTDTLIVGTSIENGNVSTVGTGYTARATQNPVASNLDGFLESKTLASAGAVAATFSGANSGCSIGIIAVAHP